MEEKKKSFYPRRLLPFQYKLPPNMEQWRAMLLHGPAVLNELADAVLLCDLWELGC